MFRCWNLWWEPYNNFMKTTKLRCSKSNFPGNKFLLYWCHLCKYTQLYIPRCVTMIHGCLSKKDVRCPLIWSNWAEGQQKAVSASIWSSLRDIHLTGLLVSFLMGTTFVYNSVYVCLWVTMDGYSCSGSLPIPLFMVVVGAFPKHNSLDSLK